MQGLIQANLHYLKQAADLVDDLEDGSYVRCEPMFYNSTIGGHLRHCLEHYEAFCDAVADDDTADIKIDYDARLRDEQVENKTLAARARIDSIMASLEGLTGYGNVATHPNVLVKMCCGEEDACDCPDDLAPQWQPSGIGRELQFLVSHTIHHYAMIRGICQRAGHELDGDFGMAPSTLQYRRQLRETPTSD